MPGYPLISYIQQISQRQMSDKFNDEDDVADNQKKFIQFKNNQIKIKKRIIPIDREQLYAENLQLKSKIRDLVETNTKMKTQLSITEKQKTNLFNIAEEQAFHPKMPQRSQSGNHKKSLMNPPNLTHLNSLLTSQLTKEKQNVAFKKILRDHKIQNERLYNQNQKLKKTMKFTRMNQILAENKELLEESLRLKIKLTEFKEAQNQNLTEFMSQIQSLRKRLTVQKDSQKKNGFSLKKQYEINNQIKERLRQIQSKKIQMQKRLNRDIKQLKSDNAELKNKLIENHQTRNSQLENTQSKKEKVEIKKKMQALEKENKRLRQENQLAQKKTLQRQSELRKNYQGEIKKLQSKGSTHKEGGKALIQEKVKHDVKTNQIQPQSNKKQDIKNRSPSIKKQNVQKLQKHEVKQPQIKHKVESNHKQVKQPQRKEVKEIKVQPTIKQPVKHETIDKKKEQIKPTESKQSKKEEQHDSSYDTDKLLESFIGCTQKQQSKQKEKEKVQNLHQQQKEKESDGEYEQIDFQDDEEEYLQEAVIKKQAASNKKADKISSLKASPEQNKKTIKGDKEEKGEKKKEKKDKSEKDTKDADKFKKSKKKLKPEKEQHEQQKKQQNQGGKEQLKLIRETLFYKFIAQKYTYNDFCNDIQSSQIKQFTIEEVMGILGEEPFLLGEQNIEHVLIYLFQTDQLTGEEKIGAKSFMKKMKKFIGKALEVDEQKENVNIGKVREIIEKDERKGKKFRAKCKQLDKGDGNITKQDFIKAMSIVSIKGQLLETALSQITYVSQDLNHLNYQFFLTRLTEEEQEDGQL